MMYKRGDIHLAKLNPKKGSEVGKLRPVLILQTDMLNDISHPTTTILPLSTKVIKDTYPLRYHISKIDKLEQDSDVLCDQIRTIDNNRIKETILTSLDFKQMIEISKQVEILLNLNV